MSLDWTGDVPLVEGAFYWTRKAGESRVTLCQVMRGTGGIWEMRRWSMPNRREPLRHAILSGREFAGPIEKPGPDRTTPMEILGAGGHK